MKLYVVLLYALNPPEKWGSELVVFTTEEEAFAKARALASSGAVRRSFREVHVIGPVALGENVLEGHHRWVRSGDGS